MRFNGRSVFSLIKSYGFFREKNNDYELIQSNRSLCPTPILAFKYKIDNNNDINNFQEYLTSYVSSDIYKAGYNYCYLTGECGAIHIDKLCEYIKIIKDFGLYSAVKLNMIDDRLCFDNLNVDNYYEKLVKSGVDCCFYEVQDKKPILYSFCIDKITIKGDNIDKEIDISKINRCGTSRIKKVKDTQLLVGLDKGKGLANFTINVEKSGVYKLSFYTYSFMPYEKMLLLEVNNSYYKLLYNNDNKKGEISRISVDIELKAGDNVISLYNPISCLKNQTILLANKVGFDIEKAVQNEYNENKNVKGVIFGIDTNGKQNVITWGNKIANIYNLNGYISNYKNSLKLYKKCVKKYNNIKVGSFAYLGTLLTGRNISSNSQVKSQLALWCMMVSPLVIDCNIKNLSDKDIKLLANKDLIAINQDKLAKCGKCIKSGYVDIIAKPLVDGDVAICILNKTKNRAFYNFRLDLLYRDNYIKLIQNDEYRLKDVFSGNEIIVNKSMCGNIDANDVKLYILAKK